MLEDLTDSGSLRRVIRLEFEGDFQTKWRQYTHQERQSIQDEIDRRLDELIETPCERWGSITNTSIEGARVNPFNGRRGDWSGTPYHPIWVNSGRDDREAAKFFGLLWKKRIIERRELWIGYRSDGIARKTFPNKGITLEGKTYFLAQRP